MQSVQAVLGERECDPQRLRLLSVESEEAQERFKRSLPFVRICLVRLSVYVFDFNGNISVAHSFFHCW